MLRRPEVGDFGRDRQGRNDNDGAVSFQRRTGYPRSRSAGHARLERGGKRLSQCRRGRNTPGGRVFIVLRLGDEIRRHPFQIRRFIGNHEQLGRARDAVDPHLAHQLPLGLRHPAIAGPDDLVHPGYGPGAIGQGGHRLGPTHAEDAGHTGQVAGRKNGIGQEAAGRGDGHDVAHACHDCRNRVHDDGRWIRGLAAGDIQPGGVEGRHPHAEHGAIGLAYLEAGVTLMLVI